MPRGMFDNLAAVVGRRYEANVILPPNVNFGRCLMLPCAVLNLLRLTHLRHTLFTVVHALH